MRIPIMQYTTLCTSCIAFMLMSHTCVFVTDHVEQECAEPLEPTPVEAGNYKQGKGKPRCI
jgi:hypothetical protein